MVARKAVSDMNVIAKLFKGRKDGKRVEFYAIKILSKSSLIKAKQVDHVFNEMTLQQQLKHPFIVRLILFITKTGQHGRDSVRFKIPLHQNGVCRGW